MRTVVQARPSSVSVAAVSTHYPYRFRRRGTAFASASLCLVVIWTLIQSEPAIAAPIVLDGENAIPSNVSTQRLARFARFGGTHWPGTSLDQRLDMAELVDLATEYRRWGEHYGVRWDYAWFQMLLETGFLRFQGGVDASHHNFAGVGAVVTGEAGQKFNNPASGAKAHVQHLALYALKPLPEAELVSPYSRKVSQWIRNRVLKQLGRPAYFTELGEDFAGDRVAWSVGQPGYGRAIQAIAKRYERWLEIDIGWHLLVVRAD